MGYVYRGGQPGAKCGEYSGYRQHQRDQTPPCARCRAAKAERSAAEYAAKTRATQIERVESLEFLLAHPSGDIMARAGFSSVNAAEKACERAGRRDVAIALRTHLAAYRRDAA